MAINACINYIRKNRRQTYISDEELQAVTLSEDAHDMSWSLLRLEPKYRDVLYLHYCEQYKVAEIAKILGKNPNTIKTILIRGREKLKSVYGGDDE